MVTFFGVGCTQKEAALPAIGRIVRVHAVSPLGERFDIYRVQAADKDRAAFQVKFHIIFQQYRPTQILPGRMMTRPPPAAEAVSTAFWIAVAQFVLPSATAPQERMLYSIVLLLPAGTLPNLCPS